MEFLREIKSNIWDPAYYADVVRRPAAETFKYYAMFALLVALLSTVTVSLTFLPSLNGLLSRLTEEAVELYPEGLEISVKDGVASSNVAEPFVVPYPAGGEGPRNLLVLDTGQEADSAAFAGYETSLLLARDALVYAGRGGVETQPLADFSDMTVTKASLQSFFYEVKPLFKYVAPLMVLFLFAFFLGIIAFALLLVLPASLLVWLAWKRQGVVLPYRKAAQASVHGLSAAVLADYVLLLVPGFRLPAAASMAAVALLAAAVVATNTRGWTGFALDEEGISG